MIKCDAALPLAAPGRSEAETLHLSCDGNNDGTQCNHISSHHLLSEGDLMQFSKGKLECLFNK